MRTAVPANGSTVTSGSAIAINATRPSSLPLRVVLVVLRHLFDTPDMITRRQ